MKKWNEIINDVEVVEEATKNWAELLRMKLTTIVNNADKQNGNIEDKKLDGVYQSMMQDLANAEKKMKTIAKRL